jgi:hypothetical protein
MALAAMPEATIRKNCNASLSQNNVNCPGTSGNESLMNPKS